MKKTSISIILFVFMALVLSSCWGTNANSKEAVQVDQQQEQYVTGQPVPEFTWSLERQEMIEIYVARNNAVKTYSVVYNPYLGVITFECPSYGYPIPGGTELTNSQAISRRNFTNLGYEYGVLPQAEPNGLYSPGTSAGTYVMCRNLENGTAYPVYVEENVMTFPYVVATDEKGRLIKASDIEKPSINIDINKPTNTTTP